MAEFSPSPLFFSVAFSSFKGTSIWLLSARQISNRTKLFFSGKLKIKRWENEPFYSIKFYEIKQINNLSVLNQNSGHIWSQDSIFKIHNTACIHKMINNSKNEV